MTRRLSPQASVRACAMRTAVGHDVAQLAHALLTNSRAPSAVDPQSPWRAYPCPAVAALPSPASCIHDRILRPLGVHAYQVALEAFSQYPNITGTRLGIFVGMGGLRAQWRELLPVLQSQQADFADSWQHGLKQLHPFWMLQHLSNNVHALLAKDLNARGEGFTFGGANAGAQAIEAACAALAAKSIDAALVVAYDSMIEPEVLVQWDGDSVPSEAAAAMMLTESDHLHIQVSAISGSLRAMKIEPNTLIDSPQNSRFDTIATIGAVGAATSVVQAALWWQLLKNDLPHPANVGNDVTCLAVGTPGLLGVVRLSAVQ
jgi:3-oxoacyl-[acyl-carrier-protein] synthase II